MDVADGQASRSLHRRALLLTAALTAAFIAATLLYARHGYALVLRVYEQQQIARTEGKNPWAVARELRDYLRVQPQSLYVRGLLLNHYIDQRQPDRALEAANSGVEIAPAAVKPFARLLVARARIANGDFDQAEQLYNQVIDSLGGSGEVHYGLAHICLARGKFDEMREHYARVNAPNNTPDYDGQLRQSLDATDTNGWNAIIRKERGGMIDAAFEQILTVTDFNGAPAFAVVLRGAAEESSGDVNEALRFYMLAAEQKDPLAAAAVRRLGGPE